MKTIFVFGLLFSITALADVTYDSKDLEEVADSNSGPWNPDFFGEIGALGQPNPPSNPWLTQGFQRVYSVLNAARDNVGLFASHKYSSLKKTIQNDSLINYPRGATDFVFCINNPTALAFVYVGDNVIHLCANVFRQSWIGVKELAQIIIHEGIHVAGDTDECSTTRFEVQAMRDSGEGIAFMNGYWPLCGIH